MAKTVKERMKEKAVASVGSPKGNGPEGGYSLGQAMELHLQCVDILADELQRLHEEVMKLKLKSYQGKPM